MTGIVVRPAGSADVPAIAAVHVQSWQHGYRGLLPAEVLDRLDPADRIPRWRAAVAESSWPGRGVLLASTSPDDAGGGLIPGPVSGFANLLPSRDAGANPATTAEIFSFYVRPDRWRRGIGRRLMAAALETLTVAGYVEATLWALEGNDRAIDFYRSLGWVADGAVKHDVVGALPIRDLRFRHRLGIG